MPTVFTNPTTVVHHLLAGVFQQRDNGRLIDTLIMQTTISTTDPTGFIVPFYTDGGTLAEPLALLERSLVADDLIAAITTQLRDVRDMQAGRWRFDVVDDIDDVRALLEGTIDSVAKLPRNLGNFERYLVATAEPGAYISSPVILFRNPASGNLSIPSAVVFGNEWPKYVEFPTHTFMATDDWQPGVGSPVTYSDLLPHKLIEVLPTRIKGTRRDFRTNRDLLIEPGSRRDIGSGAIEFHEDIAWR